MWTRIVGWAGLMALAGTLAAHAQAVVPQYTHRGYVGSVAFDAEDARVAVTSSGGFASVIDVASGRVLAVRRLVRSNESSFLSLSLEGPVLRAMSSIAGDDLEPVTWNWVDDTVELEGPSEGWLAARSPDGRVARLDHEGNLVVGRRREPIGNSIEDLAFPHPRVVVVEPRSGGVELRSARDPSRVIATLPGVGMAFDGRRVAAVGPSTVSVAALPQGTVESLDHGLGAAASGVVFGHRALAVTGRERSEVLRRGQPPVAIAGTVLWLGSRSALVRRTDGLFRVRLADLSERRMVQGDVGQVWVGQRGTVVFSDREVDRFTVVRRNGSRQRYASGGEHSVWHVRAAPGGESVVLAGRFGIQRWSREGVVDGSCDGEGLLGVDWEDGTSYSRYGRCTARGTRQSYPGDQAAAAVSDDGAIVLLGDGRFHGRRAPRARVRDLPQLECEELGYCSWEARFAAKGELLLVEANADWGQDGAENRVIRTRTGRDLFRVPAGRRFEASADGSRIAVLHGGGGSVRALDGSELFAFGSGEPDDDAPVPMATFSADGRRFAWMATDQSLEVLDAQGRVEQRLALDGRPTFVALTADGLAHGDASGTVVRVGALTHHEAAGVTPTTAACVEGHFRSLEPDLHVVRGPACTEGTAQRVGDLYVRKMGGAVRLWHGERVMTLRTIRRGERTTPMAYTVDGRWWTPGGSEGEVEAPFALRRGLQSVAAEQPVDPGLLGALLGG